ncbi:hypothetical protein A2U01_0101174, partial [Trifolium medium]|nr:hypothetical protein [Trifolium medium]
GVGSVDDKALRQRRRNGVRLWTVDDVRRITMDGNGQWTVDDCGRHTTDNSGWRWPVDLSREEERTNNKALSFN